MKTNMIQCCTVLALVKVIYMGLFEGHLPDELI